PEVFRPKTDTASVRAVMKRRAVRHEIESWRRMERVASERSRMPGQPVDVRLRVLGVSSIIEVRQTEDGSWRAPQKQWLQALETASPSDLAELPPPAAALAYCLAAE